MFIVYIFNYLVTLYSHDCAELPTVTTIRSYKIWLPVGELVNLPCDPFLSAEDQNKSEEIGHKTSAIEWYDAGGTYLHTGFILPVRVLTEQFLRGLVCNIFDRTGSVARNIKHEITIHTQPTLLMAYRVNLNKHHLFSGKDLKENVGKVFRNISKQSNTFCRETDFCYYQFVYFHPSPYEEFVMTSGVQDRNIEQQMKVLTGDNQTVSFYFKVLFTKYSELAMDPNSLDYKLYIEKRLRQFFRSFKKTIIDTNLEKEIFFKDASEPDFVLELICPSGSGELEGLISCHQCEAGYFSKPGGKCQPCEYGTYQSKKGSSKCNRCPTIYRTAEKARTKKEECIYDGPFLTAIFYYYSGRIWDNVISSHRTFSFLFLLITFIYTISVIMIMGWLSYRIHLFRKIKRRRDLAFEQLLSICTIGNINLNLNT